MPKFQITGPDGQSYEVNAPEGATEDQVLAYVQQNAGKQSAMGGGPDPAKSAERGRGRSMPTGFKAANAALQGATFSFGDELQGAVAAGGAALANALPDRLTPKVLEPLVGRSPSEAYRMMRDAARGAQDQFASDAPVSNVALQVGGGLLTGTGLKAAVSELPKLSTLLGSTNIAGRTAAAISAPTTAVGRVAAATAAGAGSGAATGAGDSESLDDMASGAGWGAAKGAAAGGLLNALGQGVGNVTKNVISRGANTGIVQDRIREGGFGSGAAQKITNWADDLARQRLAIAITRDGRTAQQVADELRTLGPSARVAVGGGKNTSDLLDTVASAPGRTPDMVEEAIRAQQRARPGEIVKDTAAFLGIGRNRLNETVETLAAERSRAAAPLYEKLRAVTLEADDNLASLVGRAQSQGADRIARAIAETRGASFSLGQINAARPGSQGVGTIPGSRVSMSDLDYLKEGLDDLIKKQTDSAGVVSRQGYALMDLRSKLLGKLDDMTKGADGTSLYKSARDAYAGPSALIDAAEAGRRLMRMDGTSIQKMTRDMSESELQAFRLGAFESIRDQVGTEGGQTQLLKMWKEPKTQEKLRAVAPSIRTYQEFADSIMGKAKMKAGLEGAGRGSQTASRNARMDDENASAMTAAGDAVGAVSRLNPIAAFGAIRNLYGRTVMPEAVRDRIGQMLLTQGPEAQGLLGDLPGYIAQANARRAAAAGRTGLLSGVGVNSLLGD